MERIRFRNLIGQLSNDRIVLLSTHIVSDIEAIAKEVFVMKKERMYVLSGTVTDATGHPVSMATVAIEHTSLGAFTDDKGHYTLELSAGKHIVAVSSVGYKIERKELNLV